LICAFFLGIFLKWWNAWDEGHCASLKATKLVLKQVLHRRYKAQTSPPPKV